MANQKTVTLPALPEGRVYVSIAADLTLNLGHKAGTVTIHPANHSAAIRDGSYAYGVRQCAGDGGALSKDTPEAEKKAGVLARLASIVDGTHKYGAGGGGSSLSTLKVVLRENVFKELVKLGKKKADFAKAVTADHEAVYKAQVSAKTARSMRVDATDEEKAVITTEAVHAIEWPKMEKAAQVEADRRDETTSTVPVSKAALLAAATATAKARATAESATQKAA